MQSQLICPKCQQTFTKANPPKKLINCQHVICFSCLNSEILCPIDRKRIEKRKYKVQTFQTDQALLDLIINQVGPQQQTNCQQQTQTHSAEDQLASKQPSNQSIQQVNNPTSNQMNCDIDRNQPVTEPVPPKAQDIKFEKCLLHSKNADLICLKDKCLICSNCGLFGQHKSHSLLAYDEFVVKYTNLMEQSYAHYEDLKKSEESISESVISEQINLLMKQKKQMEIKNLKKVIAGMINFIKSTEKLIINEIDQNLQERKQSLLKSLHFNKWNSQISQFCKQIEVMSQGTIDIFKLQKLQKYIDYADEDNPKSFISKQGQYLLSEVETYSKNMRVKMRNQINGFQCKFNNNLHSLIANSFEIKSKWPQKSKSKTQGLQKDALPISLKRQTHIDSPINIKKGREEDLLINSKSNSNKKANIARSMSPIQPIPKFQQTFDNTFKNSYKQNIITEGKEEIFLQVKEVPGLYVPHPKKTASMPLKGGINLSTNRQDPRKDAQNINSVKFMAKANSNNSSHIVEREILSVLNENKKKKKIDLPEKYIKIYDQLYKDRLDVLDLGGAFLGDQTILTISQLFESRNKLRSVKLMNNKISDDIFPQIMNRCRNLGSINLSYNNLSEKSLEWLQRQSQSLGSLTNITISNNKIVLRNVKDRIENLRKKGIKVSL